MEWDVEDSFGRVSVVRKKEGLTKRCRTARWSRNVGVTGAKTLVWRKLDPSHTRNGLLENNAPSSLRAPSPSPVLLCAHRSFIPRRIFLTRVQIRAFAFFSESAPASLHASPLLLHNAWKTRASRILEIEFSRVIGVHELSRISSYRKYSDFSFLRFFSRQRKSRQRIRNARCK